MASLYQSVDGRVYVAVGRGVWDCASRDVYNYLEGLQEGLEFSKVHNQSPPCSPTSVSAWLACIMSTDKSCT